MKGFIELIWTAYSCDCCLYKSSS